MKKIRKWVLYSGYVLAVTILFLYLLFPSDAAKEYISGYLGRQYPDYTVFVEAINPAFPPGLKFSSVTIAYRGEPWVNLEQLRVRPRYLSIFKSWKTLLFTGTAYSGKVQGTVDFQKNADVYRIKAHADLNGIQLAEIDSLQALSGRKIAGALNSTLDYSSAKGNKGKLNAILDVVQGEVGLANPVFNINNIDFESVKAVLIADRRSLKLKRCNIVGSQVDGEMTGVVLYRKPFEKSRLEFKGKVTPHHLLMASLKKVVPESLLPTKKPGGQGYPIRIYGTIEKPKFSLR